MQKCILHTQAASTDTIHLSILLIQRPSIDIPIALYCIDIACVIPRSVLTAKNYYKSHLTVVAVIVIMFIVVLVLVVRTLLSVIHP